MGYNCQSSDGNSSRWGCLDDRAVEIGEKCLTAPSNLKSNTWIGEQVDPYGDGLLLQEARSLIFRNDGGENSGWGRLYGQAVGIGKRY